MQQALHRSSLVPRGSVVENAYYEGDKAVIAVRACGSVGLCPSCGTVSRRVHSRYRRRVTDLPFSGRIVELLVIARRFRCDAVLCGRQIFTERFEVVLARSARRTARLDSIVHHLGLALGGRPAACFAKRLMLPVSKDTLLRVVRRRTRPPADPLKVIGITIGPAGAIIGTPASSVTWNGAGLSHYSRIGSPRPPKLGLPPIPRFRSSPEIVAEGMAKRQQRPCHTRYRSQIVGIIGQRQSGLPRCGPQIDAPDTYRHRWQRPLAIRDMRRVRYRRATVSCRLKPGRGFRSFDL